MPEIIEWPTNLRITDRTDPMLDFASRSGGIALDGGEQILSPLSAIWRTRIVVPIKDKASLRSLRTVKARLKGRYNYLRITMCDYAGISAREIRSWYPGRSVPHSDGTMFSDKSGYALAVPRSTVKSGAGVGTASVAINSTAIDTFMTAGVFFSINNWFYQVENWSLSGSTYTLQISPPLREAIAIGDEVDFSARSIWRLASDGEGDLGLQAGKYGAVELNLVEPIDRNI